MKFSLYLDRHALLTASYKLSFSYWEILLAILTRFRVDNEVDND